MTSHIDVSVIIPAWKATAWVERSVTSALASTGVSVEVIVVDDASPDGTWDVMQRLAAADPRVVARRLPANSGQSVARNLALSLARGAFVAVLDVDDAFAPDRLARMISVAETTGADIVVDNMLEVDGAGKPLRPFIRIAPFANAREIDLETWIRYNLPFESFEGLGYLKPLFRRETMVRVGAAYDTTLRNIEDYYIVADLLAAGARMTYMPETGYLYTRLLVGSVSHRAMPSLTRAWLATEIRFQKRHDKVFTPSLRSALKRRLKRLRAVNQMIIATETLKEGRVAQFFRLLTSDIVAAHFTLRIFAGVALSRLAGKPPRPRPAA